MYTCSTTQVQKTTLHYASDRGDHETVQLLLEKRADLNARDWVSTANTETFHVHMMCGESWLATNPPSQFSRLGIQVSLAIYVCLSGLWLGGLLYLSFLSYFFKLVCYAHVFPCIMECTMSCMYTCFTTQDQKTALHYASKNGHHETVQLLLEKGADPKTRDWVSTANTEICMYMSSPTRGSFFTALGVLCCFALFVCLTLLASFFLPSHLSFKNMYNGMYNVMYTCFTTQDQMTALHYASKKGHHETVQLLLEKGADPNAQDMVSTANTETLHVHV